MNAEILIIFPPQWPPVSPYSALPLLRAGLAKNGLRANQLDLNCKCYDALLTASYLNQLRLPDRFLPGDTRYPYRWLLNFRKEIAVRVEEAKSILRTAARFFDSREYLYAENTLRYALFLISLAFWPQRVGLDSIDLGLPSRELFGSPGMDRQFGSFIFEDVLEQILATERLESFAVVGFSIHTKFQLFYSLRLVQRYFQGRRRPHIALGGTFLNSLRRYWQTFQPIFDDGVDTIAYGRGDETIGRLYDLVSRGRDYRTCPGVIHSDGQSTHRNNPAPRCPTAAALEMDYSGLPLESYLSPVPILNIPSSTGCYWAKCRFCNYHDVYSTMDASSLAALMDKLGSEHKTRYFFLAQSTLDYEQAVSLSDCLPPHKARTWGSLARVDEHATLEAIPRLHAAGCRKLSMGLETRSPTLREKMHKGRLADQLERFLYRCHVEGIGTEVFLISGYPGETLADVRATLSFVRRLLPSIDTLSANQFSLVCNSAAYGMMRRQPEYVVDKEELSFFDVVDQEATWHYRDRRWAHLREQRADYFWEGLIDIVEQSSSHIWLGNTALRCGFPRLPEHHFLYCASREKITNIDAVGSVPQRLVPYVIGDQTLSFDADTMTIGGALDGQ